MAIFIEPPGTGSGSLRMQLEQLRSYLYKTSQQLQWAFEALQKADADQETRLVLKQSQEKQSPEKTFGQIKNLIIRSADIVKVYEDRIEKKLEGSYVAKSEFGTYQEKTGQELKLSSEQLQQLFTYTAALSQDLQGLEAETAAARAYIRTGKLTEAGAAPVYGLEIGQQTLLDGRQVFRKYARFTSDRLSFFDGSDVEVAYISDYRLYIGSAQVAGTLDLGARFRVGFDSGLVFRWTGGNA